MRVAGQAVDPVEHGWFAVAGARGAVIGEGFEGGAPERREFLFPEVGWEKGHAAGPQPAQPRGERWVHAEDPGRLPAAG